MDGRVKRFLLEKRWMHSHEEDTESTMVYRPEDFDFPPARGRRGFELHSDGKLTITSAGPTDRTQRTEGSWRLADDGTVELFTGSGEQPWQVLDIASEADERLIVRKTPTAN